MTFTHPIDFSEKYVTNYFTLGRVGVPITSAVTATQLDPQ